MVGHPGGGRPWQCSSAPTTRRADQQRRGPGVLGAMSPGSSSPNSVCAGSDMLHSFRLLGWRGIGCRDARWKDLGTRSTSA